MIRSVFELSDTGRRFFRGLTICIERFYMADKSRATNQVVKRGLVLVCQLLNRLLKRIVERYVQSKLGEGTTFKFFLPTRYKNKQDIC